MKPIVTLQNKSFDSVFLKILNFHLKNNATIFDATPGDKFSWKSYFLEVDNPWSTLEKVLNVSYIPVNKYNITFNLDKIENIDYKIKYDAIYFDPPFVWGLDNSKDEREESYGFYDGTLNSVKELVEISNEKFSNILNPCGKLFFKYTDIFSMKDRKYYFSAGFLPNMFSKFNVIDHYIIQHHHISPTAWQVKERPCGIVNYSYLTVLKLNQMDISKTK